MSVLGFESISLCVCVCVSHSVGTSAFKENFGRVVGLEVKVHHITLLFT